MSDYIYLTFRASVVALWISLNILLSYFSLKRPIVTSNLLSPTIPRHFSFLRFSLYYCAYYNAHARGNSLERLPDFIYEEFPMLGIDANG
jgi:hypothetical protein